ncbi:MAG TPA: hypothetical protein G4N98_07020 [Thermoflexia bacterium]|nr:hypothetical protein [Thermoflexia bacterium]
MQTLKISWQSLTTYYENILTLTLLGMGTLLATLLLIPVPFAWAGLWQVARQAVKGNAISWPLYWAGAKEYGLRNLGNSLLLLLGYLLIATNIWFYNQPAISPLPEKFAVWLTAFWLITGLLWAGVAFYLLSFQMEMVAPRFWLSLRNSLYLTLLHPLSTLFWLLLLGLYGILCILLPPLIVFYPGFIAILSQHATRTLIQQTLAQHEPPEEMEVDQEVVTKINR